MIFLGSLLLDAIEDLLSEGLLSSNYNNLTLQNVFGSSAYNFIISVRDNIFLNVAYTLLGLFILMELWRISVKTDGAGGGGYSAYDVTMIVLKAVFFKCIVDIAPRLFEEIFNVATALSSDVLSISSGISDVDTNFIAVLREQYDSLGFLDSLAPMILMVLVLIVVAVAVLAGTAILYLRFVEILVFLAVSPVPLATLPSQEMSQIGKSFLKSFTAVCLQGVVIVIVSQFCPLVITMFVKSVDVVGGATMIKAMFMLSLGCIIYILTLFQTSKWAKQICDAM